MTAAKKPNKQNQLNKNDSWIAHINLIFSEILAVGCDLTTNFRQLVYGTSISKQGCTATLGSIPAPEEILNPDVL
jgi:hypothetical protein